MGMTAIDAQTDICVFKVSLDKQFENKNDEGNILLLDELVEKIGKAFNKNVTNLKRTSFCAKSAKVLGSISIISAGCLLISGPISVIAIAFLVSGIGLIYICGKYEDPRKNLTDKIIEAINATPIIINKEEILEIYDIPSLKEKKLINAFKENENKAIGVIFEGADIDVLLSSLKNEKESVTLISYAAEKGLAKVVLCLAIIMEHRNKGKNQETFKQALLYASNDYVKNVLKSFQNVEI